MDLYINDYGTSIRKNGRMFEIASKENKNRISPLKIKTIIISKGISITTDAIEFAVENNIDILLMDSLGKLYGRFWHSKIWVNSIHKKKTD